MNNLVLGDFLAIANGTRKYSVINLLTADDVVKIELPRELEADACKERVMMILAALCADAQKVKEQKAKTSG